MANGIYDLVVDGIYVTVYDVKNREQVWIGASRQGKGKGDEYEAILSYSGKLVKQQYADLSNGFKVMQRGISLDFSLIASSLPNNVGDIVRKAYMLSK